MPSLPLENDNEILRINVARHGHRSAVLYFGGNAEDVSLNAPEFSQLFQGMDLFLMNYRGYGGSTGSPSAQGLFSDALALYDAIIAGYDSVIVVGRSLGSGVAVYLASRRTVDGVILLTPYDSMVSVARHHYPFLPVRYLLKDRYESASYIAEVAAPILFIIAEADQVIPRHSSDALIAAVSHERTAVVVIPAATHNTFDGQPQYEAAIHSYLDSLRAPRLE